MADTSSTPYLRTEAAADYLGLSRRTLEKWRHLGTGPRFVHLGRRLVAYVRADLDAWALRQRVSTSEPAA